MRRINISAIVGSSVSVEEQIPLIKEVGFQGFFATYTGHEPLENWARLVQKHQLEFETIHGPYQYANRMWESGNTGDEYLEFLKDSVDACHAIAVDKFILHVTVGNHAPDISSKGLERFRSLCNYAKNQNVHICFENIEPLPHLKAVMDYIPDPYHGFCWDIGHNLCYTPNIDMLEHYGNRLMCLHIHEIGRASCRERV